MWVALEGRRVEGERYVLMYPTVIVVPNSVVVASVSTAPNGLRRGARD